METEAMKIPDDAPERQRAATTFDRNVVVTAGAGTGKTTLLVDRLIHLVLREPDPLRITEVVALTFTRKAADEIRIRLRERLQTLIDLSPEDARGNSLKERNRTDLLQLMDGYHLNKEEVDRRARECLRNLERSEIGTIHSFAATLLRLFPMEAGLDPRFREDEGERFGRVFEERWDVWLDQELSSVSPSRDLWKRVLSRIPLDHLRELASTLCSENIPLTFPAGLGRKGPIPGGLRDWFQQLERSAGALLERHPEERQVERLLRAAGRMVRSLLHGEVISAARLSEEDRVLLLTSNRPARPREWESQEMEEALGVIRVAKNLLRLEPEMSGLLMDVLLPFIGDFREGFPKTGFISFDGLLIRARDLVRDHPDIREELKRRFRAILVDEFQDTDPIQYEILLYLAEQPGQRSRHWRDNRLTRGKIFVVGDPKQSIYAFRKADIEAYLHVVREVILSQDGIHMDLTTNFRSHDGILKPVNGFFEGLIRFRPGMQPAYVGIHPPDREYPDSGGDATSMPFRGMKLRLVRGAPGEAGADGARRLEGESLARWLSEEVLGKALIFDKEGRRVPVQCGHVALLMRTLTHAHHYLEPLRRRGIRFVVEGEKHFYATQEVIDAVNLLRAVDNPFDTIALVGVLRSPVGGREDARIHELHRRGLLDYRVVSTPGNPAVEGLDAEERELYRILFRLHEETRRLPVGEAVSRIFEETFLLLMSACSFQGEQAVSNLEKVRRISLEMGQEGAVTLKEVITRLTRRVDEVAEEGESALSEETPDAVRIMSVHKAKGLEFPVVILAGCQQGVHRSEQQKPVEVQHDWSTGMVGLRVGDYRDLPSVYLSEKQRCREIEEEKRVLYVAMTRAREHLTLSAAVGGRSGAGSFLEMIQEALGETAWEEGSYVIPVGEGKIEASVVTEGFQPVNEKRSSGRSIAADISWPSYVADWKQRFQQYDQAVARPYFATPTLLKRLEEGERRGGPVERGPAPAKPEHPAALLGQWAHRFLQEWDFDDDPDTYAGRLAAFWERHPYLGPSDPQSLHSEMDDLFKIFFKSTAYLELRKARILGQEVPFLFQMEGQILEGVIDLLYEREGNLYVADYKTDRNDRKERAGIAEAYRHQARIYTEAARRGLQRDVAGFHLIFLRTGEMIPSF